MRIGYLSPLLCVCALTACHGHSSSDPFSTGPADVPWVDGVWVQPVPAWGSSTRITYPYPLADLSMQDLGAFGSHQGGHPEGLDHVWLYNTVDDQVKSWADGTVSQIDVEPDQTFVTIDYGDGLQGKHMSMSTSYVHVGDTVKQGEVIGLGITGSLNEEFQLMDEKRGDGIKTDTDGYSYVSPFDYMKPEQQAELIALYQSQVVTPYFTAGQEISNSKPWEPYLTNRTLIHHQNRGTIVGEWVLGNRQWSTPDPLYFDIFTINEVTNSYGQFQEFAATDYSGGPGTKGIVEGSFSFTGTPGQVTFTFPGGFVPAYYGLYSIDESGGRAKLTLEWSPTGFPAAITSNAAVYYERIGVYVYLDAQLLGMLPPSP